MRRLSWYIGFLPLLSGCGRSDPDPPGDPAQSAAGLLDMRLKSAEACRRAILGLPLRNVVN